MTRNQTLGVLAAVGIVLWALVHLFPAHTTDRIHYQPPTTTHHTTGGDITTTVIELPNN